MLICPWVKFRNTTEPFRGKVKTSNYLPMVSAVLLCCPSPFYFLGSTTTWVVVHKPNHFTATLINKHQQPWKQMIITSQDENPMWTIQSGGKLREFLQTYNNAIVSHCAVGQPGCTFTSFTIALVISKLLLRVWLKGNSLAISNFCLLWLQKPPESLSSNTSS